MSYVSHFSLFQDFFIFFSLKMVCLGVGLFCFLFCGGFLFCFVWQFSWLVLSILPRSVAWYMTLIWENSVIINSTIFFLFSCLTLILLEFPLGPCYTFCSFPLPLAMVCGVLLLLLLLFSICFLCVLILKVSKETPSSSDSFLSCTQSTNKPIKVNLHFYYNVLGFLVFVFVCLFYL